MTTATLDGAPAKHGARASTGSAVLENDTSILTEDLPFDLGETLKCKIRPNKWSERCGAEATWIMCDAQCCDAEDSPCCDEHQDLISYVGIMCGKCERYLPPYKITWRRL